MRRLPARMAASGESISLDAVDVLAARLLGDVWYHNGLASHRARTRGRGGGAREPRRPMDVLTRGDGLEQSPNPKE